MTIVNFAVAKPLEKKINLAIKNEGFASKAEFFRFVTWRYLGERNKPDSEYLRFTTAADELAETVRKKFNGKKLPSLREQLNDLED